jgi:aryl-alcohol dehydrogenase-like predicted oxidoreductase
MLEEGAKLLNCAFDKYGINFLDTAEIYPVPTKAETQGQMDRTIKVFARTQARRRHFGHQSGGSKSSHLAPLARTQNDLGLDVRTDFGFGIGFLGTTGCRLY